MLIGMRRAAVPVVVLAGLAAASAGATPTANLPDPGWFDGSGSWNSAAPVGAGGSPAAVGAAPAGGAKVMRAISSSPVPSAGGAKIGSVSRGLPYDGSLVNGAMLPPTGAGYRSIRQSRGRFFGTDELIGGLIFVAKSLKSNDPAMPDLALGDISARNGGQITMHRSHQNGRDVDIVFFVTDPSGRPVQATDMVAFDGQGRSASGDLRLDVPRTWKLVEALLSNSYFGKDVKNLFISDPLRALFLKHARKIGSGAAGRAASLMSQPGASPHSNHFHLRIGCSAEDRGKGCR